MRSVTQHGSLRVALYPRVSGDRQVKEGYGLDYQRQALEGHVADRGMGVVEVVEEPGVSRTEFNRPGLDRLRELASGGKIDAVLAWKRDRYFGDPGLRAMFEYEMERYGVKLLAMDDSGGDRPEDTFSDGIKDLLAQLEVAKTRERTQAGTLQKVRSGKVIIGRRVNYGFKANAQRDGLEVDPTTAPVVQRIFSTIASGTRLNTLLNTLTRESIPSPTGGAWANRTLRTMIFDDVYCPHMVDELRALGVAEPVVAALNPDALYGVWYYGRRSVKTWREPGTFAKRSRIIHQPRSEWVPVPVPDVGVPRPVVEAARERIKNNVKASRASQRVWELDAGIFRCGVCGWSMGPRTTSPRGYVQYHYACSSYARPDKRHDRLRYFNARGVEAEVAQRVAGHFGDLEQAETYIRERVAAERERLVSGDPHAQERALHEQITNLERRKSNYRA